MMQHPTHAAWVGSTLVLCSSSGLIFPSPAKEGRGQAREEGGGEQNVVQWLCYVCVCDVSVTTDYCVTRLQTTRKFNFLFDFAMNNSTEISAFGPMADVENGDMRF